MTYFQEAVLIAAEATGSQWEYYCHHCRQLRLWLKDGHKPDSCGNCGSENIDVDVVNSERLSALRFG
jgi:Zn finger protein HypA/HybF involved in hydrogenase expression